VAEIRILNPPQLGIPLGQYSQIARVKSTEFIFIAGQIGARSDGTILDGFDAQCGQAFDNTHAALQSCGATWSNVVQFTTYLVHSQDIQPFMNYRLREFPKMFSHGVYPPNTLLMIDRLVKESLLFEVQTVAAV
jgi:enamine deaminase RidA (YjgF/YER057c/UK114 family)